MELIEMEFYFFNRVDWEYQNVKILALSKFQCIREFIKITGFNETYCNRLEIRESFQNASFETIQLPIINIKTK